MSQHQPQQRQQSHGQQTGQGGQGTQPAIEPEPRQGGEEQVTQQAQQFHQQQAQPQGGLQSSPPVFKTTNFLDHDVREHSAQTLDQVLADAIVVLSQVKNAHWNVRGPDFYQLHELFDDVAETLEDHVDEIAERATALGGIAYGTVQQAARATTIPAMPEGLVSGQALLQHVAQTLSAFDAQLYQAMHATEELGDLDTVDLLNEVSRDVSKALWFVEAHLQTPQQVQGGGGQYGGQQ